MKESLWDKFCRFTWLWEDELDVLQILAMNVEDWE